VAAAVDDITPELLVQVVLVAAVLEVLMRLLEHLVVQTRVAVVAQVVLIQAQAPQEATAALVLSSSKSHLRISLRSHRA